MAELPSEPPLPNAPSRLNWCSIPEGWRRIVMPTSRSARRRARVQEEIFWSVLTNEAWGKKPSPGQSTSAYFAEVRGSGNESSWRWWKAQGKSWEREVRKHVGSVRWTPGSTEHQIKRWRATRAAFDRFSMPPRREMVWSPVSDGLDRSPMKFVSAGRC